MPKRGRPTEEEMKRVLAGKKRLRSKEACFPCSQRKVKCDMKQPCATCIKRKYPHICVYTNIDHDHDHDHHSKDSQLNNLPSSSSLPGNNNRSVATQVVPTTMVTVDLPSSPGSGAFLGENSAASYLRQMGGAEGLKAQDIVPALGLHNTLGQYPFINSETEGEKKHELDGLLPTRYETLAFYNIWRSIPYPLCSFLIDREGFEADLSDYLETITVSNTSGHKFMEGHEGAARMALLLAVLALAAQYSDRSAQERRRLSRDLARRSFHALRLANFLLHPLVKSLQALLILGSTLQNDGNADAAWALLGTTTRLAQSLGLHSEDCASGPQAERERLVKRKLWLAIAQQDCILSLCYDRPTALAYMPFVTSETYTEHQSLVFQDVMSEISKIGFRLMAMTISSRAKAESILERLKEVDQLMLHASDHLRNQSRCRDLHERAQFFLLSQHRSFAITAICRPSFKTLQDTDGDSRLLHIQSIGKNALLQTVKSFLDLHSISVYPTRTWACIHEALSSALLLTILGETRKSKPNSLIQNRLIDVILSRDHQNEFSQPSNNALSSSHFRALMALRSLVRQQSQEAPADGTSSPQKAPDLAMGMTKEQCAPAEDIIEPVLDLSALDLFPSDLSPMACLDSILWEKPWQADDTEFLDLDFGN